MGLFYFFQNCFFFVQSESLWLCGYFLCWVFDFNSFLVVKMTVWNTMFRMSTMPCLPTLIGTTLRWRVLPSKLVKLNHSIFFFYNIFLLQICVKFMAHGFFCKQVFQGIQCRRKGSCWEIHGISGFWLIVFNTLWFCTYFYLFIGLNLTCGFVLFGKSSEQTGWKSEAAVYSDAFIWIWSCREGRCLIWYSFIGLSYKFHVKLYF